MMPPSTPTPITPTRWAPALSGLGLLVFAIVALTGPGRIDIEDGQTRFESGKNLVEYGDPAIRDPRLTWFRFPGRNGLDYTYYRFPQELIAAGCVLLADRTGPATEARRHFIFSMHGAVVAALLAVLYAVWFRHQGLSPRAAIAWAAGGIFCTPNWYYSTSTFDDGLGALVVVAALVMAHGARNKGGWRLVAAAACVGLSLNCKQPLAAVLLPALAFADKRSLPLPRRLGRAAVLGLGLAAGFAAYEGYQWWKFPPETRGPHAAMRLKESGDFTNGNPAEAILDYAVGPSSGSVWYFPPVLLCAAGLGAWWHSGRRIEAAAVVAAIVAVAVAYSMLTFYKGGVCWGPRYLTPLFALAWLFAPDGAARLGCRVARMLLVAGLVVQLLAGSVVPERMYVERKIPTGFYAIDPWLYFRPEISHLFNRPHELIDALAAPPAPEFTPGPTPTFTMPVVDPPYFPGPKGIEGVRRYTLLNSLRPWWATYPHLPESERPADPATAAAALGALAIAGLGLLTLGLSARRREME